MGYYRVILRIPIALTFDVLTDVQKNAINSVFGQFAMPMPGTQTTGLWKLADAVTLDTFKPENMSLYGITWPIVGMWDEQGESLLPFDADTFIQHLPEPEDGGDKVLHEPHRWAGWPACFG